MTRNEQKKLHASLVEALENWWDNGAQADGVKLPWVGDKTFELMSTAALAVLSGIADAQKCNIRDGIFQELV